MNNTELELKIKEIFKKSNFFDLMEEAYNFSKEYRASEFYKKTKMPLTDVLKLSKIHYMTQFEEVSNKLQECINNLSFEKFNSIIEGFGGVFATENEEILSTIKEISTFIK